MFGHTYHLDIQSPDLRAGSTRFSSKLMDVGLCDEPLHRIINLSILALFSPPFYRTASLGPGRLNDREANTSIWSQEMAWLVARRPMLTLAHL